MAGRLATALPKVAAEVSRLAVLKPADCEPEIVATAERLHQPPWLLDLFDGELDDRGYRRTELAAIACAVLCQPGKSGQRPSHG